MSSSYWKHPQIKEFFDYLKLKSVSTYTRLSDSMAKEIALSIPTAADSPEIFWNGCSDCQVLITKLLSWYNRRKSERILLQNKERI